MSSKMTDTLSKLTHAQLQKRSLYAWSKQATQMAGKSKSNLKTEYHAAEWLNISLPTLRRIRKSGKITYYEIHGGIRYSNEQLQDYLKSVSKTSCQTHDSKSENSGSHNAPVLQTTMQPISTPGPDKLSDYLLAKATFKKPK